MPPYFFYYLIFYVTVHYRSECILFQLDFTYTQTDSLSCIIYSASTCTPVPSRTGTLFLHSLRLHSLSLHLQDSVHVRQPDKDASLPGNFKFAQRIEEQQRILYRNTIICHCMPQECGWCISGYLEFQGLFFSFIQIIIILSKQTFKRSCMRKFT